VMHQMNRLQRIVIICKGFSHPHQDDIGDVCFLRKGFSYRYDLIKDLRNRQVPFPSYFSSQTKSTPKGTPHLGRKTEGQAIFIRDENTFNSISVFELE